MATEMPIIESYNADEGKGIPILTKQSTVPRGLLSESNVLSGLNRPISIRRIYAERQTDEIEKLIRDMLNSEEES